MEYVWYAIGLIVILLVFYIIIVRNSLVQLNNKVKEAFATMDVYLKKRWDLIPNLVETVKGYSKHEKETLENIVQHRNNNYDKMSNEEKLTTNEKLSTDISKLMLLVENYPDLKASQNFMELSKELNKVEEDIANSRKYYNAVVRTFNNKIEMFPSNLVAAMFKYNIQKMFESAETERENVKVKF